jgi:hypothetical protein
MKNKLLILAMSFALTTQIIIAQVPSYVPSSGLVGYWPFTGNANDISGNANSGTNNGATLTTDRFGNANSAYNFNGTSSFINVLNSSSLQFNGALTISSWINTNTIPPNATNSAAYILSKGADGGTPNSWVSYIDALGSALCIFNSSGALNSCSGLGNPISINNWINIIYTFDGVNANTYINGILSSTTSSNNTIFSNIYDLKFGRRHTSGLPYFFNGKIDDIGIWNRALTPSEITSLYQAEVSCQSLVINSGTLSSFNPPVYQNTITIYPNPANDNITIDCGNLANASGWTIKIINTLGQEVFSGAMNTQQYVVPLNSWSGQGVYFVKIYDASNNLLNTKKIILQNF